MPRALITGGAGAIGSATARRLSAEGWQTLLVDVVDPPAHLPEGAEFSQLDLTDQAAVEDYLATAPEIDAYAGIAGIGTTAPFLEQSVDGWRRLFEINLISHLLVSQDCARRWVSTGREGRIVLVSSWIDVRPWPGTAAYSSSKAALDQLARAAALELAPYGIRVNVVAPGVLGEGMAGEEAKRDPLYAERVARSVPLGRLQTADDVAEGIAFLLGPGGDHMTGSRLLMDGGTTLVSGAGVQVRA